MQPILNCRLSIQAGLSGLPGPPGTGVASVDGSDASTPYSRIPCCIIIYQSINQSTLNHNRVWLYMVFFYCRYFVHRAIVAHKRKLSFWRRHRRESQGRILPFSIMHKGFHFKSLFIPCVSLEWTPNYHPRTKRLHETQIVCIVTFRENTEL